MNKEGPGGPGGRRSFLLGSARGMVGLGTARVSSGECTNCGRCVEVCADGAINFAIGNIKFKPVT